MRELTGEIYQKMLQIDWINGWRPLWRTSHRENLTKARLTALCSKFDKGIKALIPNVKMLTFDMELRRTKPDIFPY
jgi:hypothetical protein